MARFDPKLLVPAQQTPEFSKAAATRSVQQVALGNIERMRELFPQVQKGEKLERKPTFKIAGDKVAFTIRVNNSAIVLERVKVRDTDIDVKEMSVPTANFLDALTYYADRIRSGEYDAQLTTLSEKRDARTSKMRSTRAATKAA
jgi:hypothetical protein